MFHEKHNVSPAFSFRNIDGIAYHVLQINCKVYVCSFYNCTYSYVDVDLHRWLAMTEY